MDKTATGQSSVEALDSGMGRGRVFHGALHDHVDHGTATASIHGIPLHFADPVLVTYRSVGIGLYGVAMRFLGMPLEKVALYLNSSQVSSSRGTSSLRQALHLTFREGYLAPYRVVGPASVLAWFFQYSVMGLAFQFFDHGLSQMLGVKPVYYGTELMEPATTTSTRQQEQDDRSLDYRLKSSFKIMLAPILSAALETMVSNRAEVQRYYGREQFVRIEQFIQRSALSKAAGFGMAFGPNFMRNQIMCQTTFVLTPITYKLYFPQEHKNQTTLFWYGLGMNIFVGNVVAITQQALWGRSLDYLASTQAQSITARMHPQNTGLSMQDYSRVIRQGLEQEGMKAFFTIPKWSSRVMMNAPVQGVLPWFYNEVLPLGEELVLRTVGSLIYEPLVLAFREEGNQHIFPSQPATKKL